MENAPTRGNRNRKDRGELLLDPHDSIVIMRRSRVAVRFLASAIVICIAYGLLSDHGMPPSILKENLLVPERSLPSSMLHGSEEQVYLPLGEDESKSTPCLKFRKKRTDLCEEANVKS
jgi:hypothetical protein